MDKEYLTERVRRICLGEDAWATVAPKSLLKLKRTLEALRPPE